MTVQGLGNKIFHERWLVWGEGRGGGGGLLHQILTLTTRDPMVWRVSVF